ncbi:MAG: sigma-70 family RNA polymerase sigma factor [Pseudomonadota bacterium]
MDPLTLCVQRIVKGDERALETLYDSCCNRVYYLAKQILNDDADAEEVTEDVFIKVWRTAASYDEGRGKVLTWLLTICRSHALDRLRARARRQRLEQELAAQPGESETLSVAALGGLVRGGALQRHLAELPTEHAQMVYLAYFKGYSHSEIAAYLDLQLGTVKSTLRRTLIRLREELSA